MRTVLLVSLYWFGLFLLAATLRREQLQLALIERGLLLPSAELQDKSCARAGAAAPRRAPRARTERRRRDATARAAADRARAAPAAGDARYVGLRNDGSLYLHGGPDASADVLWRSKPRFFWRKPPVADDYWATIRGPDLRIGRGGEVVWSKPVAKCGPLGDAIV